VIALAPARLSGQYAAWLRVTRRQPIHYSMIYGPQPEAARVRTVTPNPTLAGRRFERAVSISDIVCRLLVGGFALWVVARSNASSCTTGDFCDDPGLKGLLVAPAVLYLGWQLLAIALLVAGLTRNDPSNSTRNVAIIGWASLPRVLWLLLLTTATDVPLVIYVMLAMSIVTLMLVAAYGLSWLRPSGPG
jgi:hypothetical protein